MLYQDFVGSIIGSFIATIFSILTWFIIEFIKKLGPKRKLKRNIRKLYEEFAKKELEDYLTIRISNLIDDIGKKKLLTILKLTKQKLQETIYSLSYGDFGIIVINGATQHEIKIRYKKSTYDYYKPEENKVCVERFLEFYEEQCKLEKIKLKKPKQSKKKNKKHT